MGLRFAWGYAVMNMRLLAASLVALACVADESCSPWYDEDCIAVVCCGDSITEGADVLFVGLAVLLLGVVAVCLVFHAYRKFQREEAAADAPGRKGTILRDDDVELAVREGGEAPPPAPAPAEEASRLLASPESAAGEDEPDEPPRVEIDFAATPERPVRELQIDTVMAETSFLANSPPTSPTVETPVVDAFVAPSPPASPGAAAPAVDRFLANSPSPTIAPALLVSPPPLDLAPPALDVADDARAASDDEPSLFVAAPDPTSPAPEPPDEPSAAAFLEEALPPPPPPPEAEAPAKDVTLEVGEEPAPETPRRRPSEAEPGSPSPAQRTLQAAATAIGWLRPALWAKTGSADGDADVAADAAKVAQMEAPPEAPAAEREGPEPARPVSASVEL